MVVSVDCASRWLRKGGCLGVEFLPSHWRPSLVASLHSVGPSHDCGRGTSFWSRWLAPLFMSPEVGVIWLSADGWLGQWPPGPMPQLQGGVRHGLEVSRFPNFWPLGGMGILPKAALACAGGTWVWSVGLFSSIFFSTSIKKKKRILGLHCFSAHPSTKEKLIKKEYCRCSVSPTPYKWLPPELDLHLSREPATLAPLSRNSGVGCSGSWPPLHCGTTNTRTRGCSWSLIALWGSLTWVWEGMPWRPGVGGWLDK